jgi:hypothetical protein
MQHDTSPHTVLIGGRRFGSTKAKRREKTGKRPPTAVGVTLQNLVDAGIVKPPLTLRGSTGAGS